MTSSSGLYVGQVYHKRFRPREHVLRYSVFSLLLDLAEIDGLDRQLWLFSRNRFNLFGFHDKDFGEREGEPLDDYVDRKLSEAGIHTMPAKVLLSSYPRILGYAFNPLSLFYCLDRRGRCFAVVHEVHNTFGERHAYVLPVSGIHTMENPITAPGSAHPPRAAVESAKPVSHERRWIHQQADKQLFVSPFAHMGMSYKFRINVPGQKQVIVIDASDENGTVITASYTATRDALNALTLARVFCRIPLLSVKVVAGIHWEALRLWIKGVPLFKHQPKRTT